jgi:hypothetical protein
VTFKELGTATSAATFFRSIGGSVGVAVFGTIFANRFAAALPSPLRHTGNVSTHFTPAQLKALKHTAPDAYAQYLHAFGHALHIVFLSAVPFAALGIVLALLLREVPLRRTTGRNAGMEAADSQAIQQTAEAVDRAEAGRDDSGVPEVSSAESPATTR